MKKFISSILILSIVFYAVRLNASVKLSERGYDVIATSKSPEFKQTIKSAESQVSKMIADLPYQYKFPQQFIDGMILTAVSLGKDGMSKSLFYERLNKCRVNGPKMKILDYKFVIAAIRDNTDISYKQAIYDLMVEPVFEHEAKIKEQEKTKPVVKETKIVKKEEPELLSNEKVAIKLSKEGKEMIKKFEGCSLKAYWDVNGYSIGYGHHSNVKKKDKITKKQADAYFEEDVKWCEAAAARLISNLPYKYNFSQGFIDGLCSLIYNCGEDGVRKTKFYRSLKKCRVNDEMEMNAKDYAYAVGFVKNTYISCDAHKSRRKAEHASMLD